MNEKFETSEAGNAYLVLSVKQIRSLLKQATAGAHEAGLAGRKVGKHCLVIRSSLVRCGNDPDLQFRSCDIKINGGGL